MMDIILEVAVGRHLGENLLDNTLMVFQNLVKGVGAEVITRHQIDEFTEGESAKVIGLDDTVELRILILESHHATTCKYNLEIGIEVVTLSQLCTPVGLLENLVYQQYTTTMTTKFSCKIGYTAPLEIKVVHVDIQALAVCDIKLLLGILEQEGCLAYATCSLNANHAVVPIDFIHQCTTNGRVDMLNQVTVCTVESFHSSRFVLKTRAKVQFIS